MDWKMNGVSIEPEEILETLKHYDLPLGVIIFGADSALKADVYRLFRSRLGQPLSFDRKGTFSYTGQIRTAFHKGHPVLICSHGDKSTASDCHSLSRCLRELGAHTVVGVYANVSRIDAIDFRAIDSDSHFSHQAYYRQINSIVKKPPSPEDFHSFIVVESSDGDYPSTVSTIVEED